jgi:hypothetical protein
LSNQVPILAWTRGVARFCERFQIQTNSGKLAVLDMALATPPRRQAGTVCERAVDTAVAAASPKVAATTS